MSNSSKNQNDRRHALLGMPYGTAKGRLTRQILLNLLTKHNENFCFVCGKEILATTDFSIEHKLPWESTENVDLFWDLDNISFSHRECNLPHKRRSGKSHFKELAPDGMKWCFSCKSYLNFDLFSPKPAKHDGKDGECRTCGAERKRKHRLEQAAD